MRYRARAKAFVYRIKYPGKEGKAKVLKLISSNAHTAPIAKLMIDNEIFYNPAFKNMAEGQEITIGGKEVREGDILELKDIPTGTHIYSIEIHPRDGGKLVRSSGSSATVIKKQDNKVAVLLPSKKEKWLQDNCRATIGVIAGEGRLEKPIVKAGKKFYIMKTKNKLWPRTSAVKMNAVDHPFGSGRGKNLTHGTKGKIPKLNAPPGAKVGTIRPRRTGRRKK